MPALRRIAVVLILFGAALPARPVAAIEHVSVLLSESGGAYAEVAEAIHSELKGFAEVSTRLASESPGPSRAPVLAIVAVGTEACEHTARNGVLTNALLCVLVPRTAFERIAAGAGERRRILSAIVLDQPPARQLALIRIAMPERHRVAVLVGEQSMGLAAELSGAASASAMRVVTARVESVPDLGPVLQQTLRQADVLLAVPDSAIYNSQTIHNILRTTFRMRLPMVAFSPAYVRAGALLAVYSTPGQIGAQAGRSIRALLSGHNLPALQFPKAFMVSTNPHVARSLGIALPDENVLASRLHLLEAAR